MFRLEKLDISGFKSFADRAHLTFGEGITAVVGPNGCGKCLIGDSLVTLADGRDIPIGELVEAALSDSGNVEILDDGVLTRQNPHNVSILSLNLETLRLEPRPVAAFIKRETTPYLLRVRTRSGREVTATPYHPFFTMENGGLKIIKAEELKEGVRLALPRHLPVSGEEVNLPPLEVLDKFKDDDNVFVSSSDELRTWARDARAGFGTYSEWSQTAGVSPVHLKGLLGGQAINTASLARLAHISEITPPLDGRLKAHSPVSIQMPSAFTPDLARFLGLLVAEGRNTGTNQVRFVNADSGVNNEFARLAQTLFGVKVYRKLYKPKAEDSLIFSHALGMALERLFNFPVNSSSADKEIPPQLLRAKRDIQWAFLSGLFEGDAYVSVCIRPNGKPAPPYIEFATASLNLARQVVGMLLRLGVFARLRPRERYASNTVEKRRQTYYSVLIYGTEQLSRVARHLTFVGEKRRALEALREINSASNPNLDLVPGVTPLVKEAARLAGVKIKPHRREIPKLATYTEHRCEASRGGLLEVISQIQRLGETPEMAREPLDKLSALATSDIYWDEIVGVEQVTPLDEWVYDLSIAQTHNFVAENIIVHNSNLGEAISWVLGEQSAKHLRGGKMEDVIFSGTRDRKPTGMAEVILTLVAVEDIAERESEDSEQDDENEYYNAIENAERAAEAARSIVEEMTEDEEAAEPDQAAPTEQAEESASPDSQDGEASVSTEIIQTATLLVEGESAEGEQDEQDGETEGEQTKPQKKTVRRTFRRRKRNLVAISAGERITVGRRLYRTGDSEYLMNGRPCLLRDIQDLFAGTGLGGAHYAIIEQGRIGQILSSKPLDRRALIEEAAGITKFKSRKRAAELKLESAKQNLTRLNDIISEVERQINSLKRQAQKARRYRRLREEMRALLKIVFAAQYHRLNDAFDRVNAELEKARLDQTEMDRRLSEKEGEHRAVSAEARAAEDRLAGLRERASSIELEADRAHNRKAFDERQAGELTARIEELERDQETLNKRLELLTQEAERQAEALESLEGELNVEQADLLEREGDYQKEMAQLREAESRIEQLRQQMLTEIGMTERLRNLSANLEDALRRLDLRQTNLRAESERAAARLEETSGEHDRVKSQVESDRSRGEDLTGRIAENKAAVTASRDEEARLRSELEAIHTGREAAQHRLASLEDLDAHHAYYSDAVQHVLSAEHAASINAIGTLADFVEVEPQFERLVESLFGRELQCMLVPTIDDALAGVNYINAEGLGRGAFLVVGLHGGEGEPSDFLIESSGEDPESRERKNEEAQQNPDSASQAQSSESEESAKTETSSFDHEEQTYRGEGSKAASLQFEIEVLKAIDLLGMRPEIKPVVERAFPDKCDAAVVPDMEAALLLSIENPSRIYVTIEGEQVSGGRLIVTGAQAGRKGASLLGLKREIKQLRVRVETLGDEEQRAASDLERIHKQLEEAESSAEALDLELRQHEKAAVARDSQFEGLARDLERAEQHVRVVESELQQTAEERAELESRINQLAGELKDAESSHERVQQSLASEQSDLVELRARVEQLSEELSSARASVAARVERLQAAGAENRRTENEAEELRSRINRNRFELYESQNRIEQLAASQTEAGNAAERYEAERTSLTGEITSAAEALKTTRARMDELEADLSDMRQKAAAAHDLRGQIEVERARIESEADHLKRTCHSELAMSLEDVVTSVELGQAADRQWSHTADSEEDEAESAAGEEAQSAESEEARSADETSDDLESQKARLEELRAKLESMGPVNMMALEELEEADERFRFLSEQRRDILDSIKATEEALSEIKRRSRERFRHAFAHINRNFQSMFVELFGGGRGEMILIDEEDVLESGIDIIAQPPGKRLQNVLLLSGGEKAMSAIALVLAIFQYRPSPFCILDEVDAPLDEVNVGRFSDKVVEMSRETQFLVVTHNKQTMESARAMYGVTMEEPGISKLVSVRFE